MYKHYRLSGMADTLQINGAVEQSVKLNANGFFRSLLCLPQRRSVDLLRVAAGVYAIDRICKRRKRGGNESGARQLQLTFAVQDVDFWQQADVQNLILEILQLLSGDDWRLEFVSAGHVAEDPGYQEFLPLPASRRAERVGLYSGGLDSAAGLVNRLMADADNYLLVTVDHRSGLHTRIRAQLGELAEILVKHGRTAPSYLHSTLGTSLAGGKAKRMAMQEKTQRSRAFLFCTAAAIAADAYRLETVEMFENGVGSINLPLMSGMLGNGLATNGAHPTFLHLMSKLASLVARRPIRFVLPFADLTKAEMLKELSASPELAVWAQASRSCIHTSIRDAGKTHCGHCPGCIERRQAFKVAGITEDVGVYQMDIFSDAIAKEGEAAYFGLYQLEALDWLSDRDGPRDRMKNHLRLSGVPEAEDERIMKLQVKHSREVFEAFGPPFQKNSDVVFARAMPIRG